MTEEMTKDENDIRKRLWYISFPSYTISILVFFMLGFLAGWWYNERPDWIGPNLLAFIILAIGFRMPLKMWKWWMDETHHETNKAIAAYEVKAKEQEKKYLEKKVKEQIKSLEEQLKPQTKLENKAKSFPFTSDNFDEAAVGILLPIIHKAKKQKLKKVTGSFLIGEFLKSLK